MFMFTRSPRHSIAAVATVGALAAAFVIVPSLAAAPAFASDATTAASVFTDLNAERNADDGAAALLPNGFANTSALGLAKLYEASGHCKTSASYPPPGTSGLADEVPQCVKVPTSSSEASAIVSAAVANDSAVINSPAFYNVVGVGVYTHGTHVYAVIDMLWYNTLPKEKISLGPVTFTGTQAYGSTLSGHYVAVTDNGTTSGVGYADKWVTKGGVTLGTSSTFTPSTQDIGIQVHLVVTVTKTGFQTVSGTSAWTNQIAKGKFKESGGSTNGKFAQLLEGLIPPVPTVTPSVTDVVRWYRDGHQISNPTPSAYIYTAKASDVGHQITFTDTFSKSGYTTLVLTYSTPTHFPGLQYQYNAPTLPGASISDTTPTVGETLTAEAPGWLGTITTSSFTWNVNGVVKGTGSTLLVKSGWVGRTITVTYTASGSAYETTSVTSAKTSKVVN